MISLTQHTVWIQRHRHSHFETTLRQLWDNFETTLRQLWDNYETTLRQLWDNFKTTWWPPQYRSWAQVRCSATPGTQTGRLWLSPTAIGRWRWSRRTCKHFAPLCSTVWQCVTLCNTLQHTVTLVHRLCCTHGRVANSWPSSTSTTSGWPGSTGLPGRSRENYKLSSWNIINHDPFSQDEQDRDVQRGQERLRLGSTGWWHLETHPCTT